MAFYSALGFVNNPQFSDDQGSAWCGASTSMSCFSVMRSLPHSRPKPIADTKHQVAGLFSLSVSSDEEVDRIVGEGLRAGGIEPHEKRDYGFMQQRTIEDFDGHTWEIFIWI